MTEAFISNNRDQAPPPRDLTGLKLGRFSIRERLGAGGMGVVYRAHDERLDREVALKVLPPGILGDEKARLRFRREALALSRLNHPNIAILHDLDTQDGIDFLVMELIPGDSLDRKLAAGPLPEQDVRRLGEQMAKALAAAHERGVVHRDLKPANLKLTPDGRLKILDFGIAKLLQSPLKATEAPTSTDTNAVELDQTDPALSVSLLTQDAVVGTVPYMSPEQLRGGVVDAVSDVYSSGVVLYEMCCGQRPFPHTDYRRLAEAILNEAPVSPSKLAPISPGLQAIILKALQKDSRRRYQSAGELLADLRRLAPDRQQRASKVIDSIAVLPFENQNVATEYLSEGITENLIHSLSELPSMKKVIARSSVFRYKGRQVSPEDVGRELNVRAVLLGRVVQKGDTISITAELVDSTDARHLWGGQYRRNLTGVTEVQQEIADDIAEKLKLRLAMRRRKPAACKVNPEAYRSYLKGRYFWNKRPAQGMVHKAIEHFERATEHDPKFALAYVGLADCYNTLGRWESGAMSPRSAFPQAKAAASRALRLDSSLAEAHSALAYVSMHYDWEWATAGEGFQRALRLNPNSSHAHHWYAHYLIGIGRIEEALAESFRILELDPLDVIINAHLAWHYCLAHQFPDAVDASKKTLELEPHSHLGYFFLGWAYEQMRMFSQAVEALEKSLALSGGNAVMKAALGHAYALAGDHTAALRVIQELRELSKTTYVSSYEIGVIYAAMDNDDEVFAWLDTACEERSGWLPYINAEPRLDHVRADPRFARILQRIGLPISPP